MAVFKPIELSPSMSTIDANAINRFSWRNQGGIQYSYTITILENTSGTTTYTSGLIYSSNQYHDLEALVLTNGVDYKWKVALSTNIGDTTSDYEFFTTAATPVVTFLTPDFSKQYDRIVENFSDVTEWTASSATITQDTVNGNPSIVLTANAHTGTFSMTKTGNFTLDEFRNGILSTTSDYISLYAYTNHIGGADNLKIRVEFGDGSDYFYYDFTITDEYLYTALKSAFTSSGSPDWSDITYYKLSLIVGTSMHTLYVNFALTNLYRVGDGTNAVFNDQDINFSLGYTQAESIAIKKYKFILYDENQEKLIDTDWLYDLLLNYTFAGLTNTTGYYIEGIITSQYDQDGSTCLQKFYIDYSSDVSLPDILTIPDDTNGLMEIDFSNVKYATATTSGTVSFYGSYLSINSSSDYILFSEEIPDEFTLTLFIALNSSHNGDILQLGSNVTIGFNSSTHKFYYNDKGTYIYQAEGAITLDTATLFFGITSQYVIVKKNRVLIATITI
jgi:hypothetical protein